MTTTLLHRGYARILRLVGLQTRGWDHQFTVAPGYYGSRSPVTVAAVERLCAGGHLLEFGCGEGDLPHALAAGTFSGYHGYDISHVAIDRACARAAASAIAPLARFDQGDMARWPGGERAHLIVAEECLNYLPSPALERFLARCMAALDAEGAMLVIMHSATKHHRTLETCRGVCDVVDDVRVGERAYLTLRPRRAA